MNRQTWRNTTRTLTGIACLAFCCRMVIPTGFMPAAFGEGGPFVLCPTGLPSGLLNDGGHQHGDDSGHDISAWEFCPLGMLFDDAPLFYQTVIQYQQIQTAAPTTQTIGLVVVRATAAFRSRAPPSSTSSV